MEVDDAEESSLRSGDGTEEEGQDGTICDVNSLGSGQEDTSFVGVEESDLENNCPEIYRNMVEALLDLLELKDKHSLSINCFESVLAWGKTL